MRGTLFGLGLGALCLLTTAVEAQTVKGASAKLHDTEGTEVGAITLRQTEDQGVWLDAKFDKLPPGVHAFHIHETGKCEGNFESAGAHYAPGDVPGGHKHGVLAEGGPHAGDMPNIHVPADGKLTLEIFVHSVSLDKGAKNTLFDDDGSAFVVHKGVDDYKSQPAGNAGARIACGVITNKVDSASR
jgi:Cu-Zn family superoxide dismutase